MMGIWIALFRGINVGGTNILPMARLRQELEGLNFKKVRTYIQSGNAVFESSRKSAGAIATSIEQQLERSCGIRPKVIVIDRLELAAALKTCPFTANASDPKNLYLHFLAEPAASPDLRGIEAAKGATESWFLANRFFYLLAPDGVGRSKLAQNVEKYLGVTVTARNLRTVDRLFKMATESET